MSDSIVCRLVSVLSLSILIGAAARAQPDLPRADIPLTNRAPIIDGTIHEEEWAGTLRGVGLYRTGQTLDDRHAAFWLGCDGTTLYIAMRSELPPGGQILNRVKANKDRDQVMVTHDDTIELWIDPHHGVTAKDRDQRYFQIITNANGALYDIALDPARPQQKMNAAWRVDWRFASSTAEGHWDAEMAIPLKSLGASTDDLNHPWGFRIVRNWKNPNAQADWAPRTGPFDNRDTMAIVNWKKTGPLVRVMNLRSMTHPGTDLKLQLANPGDSQQDVKLKIDYRSAQNPERNSEQVYHLNPGAKQEVELKDETMSGIATASILATAASGEPAVYFRRTMQWSLQRPEKLWTVMASAAKAISLDFGFYPSYHKLKARLDISGLKQASQVTGAGLKVLEKDSQKVLAEAKFGPFHEGQSEVFVDLPKLKEGTYQVSAQLTGQGVPTQPVVRDFVRQKFEWENNTIGISDEVIPPFTPLKVEGNTVESVLRRHTMNNQGLWDQIVSEDKPILAGPMRFEVEVGGKSQSIETGTLAFTQRKPNQVRAESSWRAGPIQAQMEETYDYDGMMKVTMHLTQQGDAPVQKLDLVIPIRADVAELMHVISDGGTHFQYSGLLPKGQGLIWESKNANHPASPGTFAPYIWIGDERQGVAWFADNDRDWLLDDKVSTQTVQRRKDGTVVLRMHLITRPGALNRRRTIVFALQATPTKPMPQTPKPWRKWRLAGSGEDLLKITILGSGYAWGNYGTSMDIYPRDMDFGIYDLFRRTRKSGEIDQKAVDAWLAKYQNVNDAQRKMYRREVMWGMRLMKGAGTDGVVIPYTNARGTNFGREFQTFQDEWLIRRYTTRQWPPASSHGGMSYDAVVSGSYRDYSLWYLKKMLDSGAFDGIYFDDVFLQAGMNDISGSAWRDDDGTLRPGYGLFNMRQYLKRVAVLDYQERKGWFNIAHMTNTQIVPITTWVGMNLDWEMHYGMDDFQDRFSRDFIRTETIGLQSGCVPVVLPGIKGEASPQRKAFVERTQTAATVVHEIKVWNPPKIGIKVHELMDEFGYGQTDCRVFDYWQKPFPAKLTGADAEMLVLARDGRALVFIASYGDTGNCNVALDPRKLGLKAGGSFVNLEDGKTVEKTGEFEARIELPRHDFRIIEYK